MEERVGDEKLIIITNKCNCKGHEWPYKIPQLNALHSSINASNTTRTQTGAAEH